MGFNRDRSSVKDYAVQRVNNRRDVINYTKDWIPKLKHSVLSNNRVTVRNVVRPKSNVIRTMPEPMDIMYLFKSSKTTEESISIFKDYLASSKDVKEFTYDNSDKGLWFNTTSKGIGLRLGYSSGSLNENDYDTEGIPSLLLGDDAVHGIMAGRTGSGKSVTINDIICNLFYEYAPWELDLYLADFKLVELSRYANNVKSPHVKVVAATDMMEYVVSLMYNLYLKMIARQKFFEKLGIQKVADFRNEYGIVMPQSLLLVDEFQQMYATATSRQIRIINSIITQITKLGRATGYHLMFASQSLNDTLSNDVLSNFKMKIVLGCDDNISSKVLGNGEGKDIRGKGKAIANYDTGAKEDNKYFRTPFLNSESERGVDSPLTVILKEMKSKTDSTGYDKGLKFFKDDYIRPLEELEKVLKQVDDNLDKVKESDNEVDDVLFLGDTALYTEGVDLCYAYLKNVSKQSVLLVGDSLDYRAYMYKLLAVQFKRRNIRNILINWETTMNDYYDIKSDIHFDNTNNWGNNLKFNLMQTYLDTYKTIYDMKSKGIGEFNEIIMYLIDSNNLDDYAVDKDVYNELCDDLYVPCEDYLVDKDQAKCFKKCIKIIKDSKAFKRVEIVKKSESEQDKELPPQPKKLTSEQTKNFNLGVKKLANILALVLPCVESNRINLDKLQSVTLWILAFDRSDESKKSTLVGKIADFVHECSLYKIRCVVSLSDVSNIDKSFCNEFAHVIIKSSNEKSYLKMDMEEKSYSNNIYYRYKNRYENINDFNGGFEVLNNDEALFKRYDYEFKKVDKVDILQGIVY